eukprot:1443832-Ditylum_brightwellii.AAC.2
MTALVLHTMPPSSFCTVIHVESISVTNQDPPMQLPPVLGEKGHAWVSYEAQKDDGCWCH